MTDVEGVHPDGTGAPLAPPAPPTHIATSGPTTVTVPGRSPGALSVVGNVLWLVLSGIWLCLAYVIAGLIQCVTIIGIPFGVQSFKLAGFALWPFGRAVVKREGRSRPLSLVGNVLWFVLAGVWLALAHVVTGILLCLTILGIPLGLANFKLVPLALWPFGRDIVRKGSTVDPAAVSF